MMESRAEKIARLQREIAAGTFYTEEKLRRAMPKLIADLPAPIWPGAHHGRDPWCGCDRCADFGPKT